LTKHKHHVIISSPSKIVSIWPEVAREVVYTMSDIDDEDARNVAVFHALRERTGAFGKSKGLSTEQVETLFELELVLCVALTQLKLSTWAGYEQTRYSALGDPSVWSHGAMARTNTGRTLQVNIGQRGSPLTLRLMLGDELVLEAIPADELWLCYGPNTTQCLRPQDELWDEMTMALSLALTDFEALLA